MSRKLIIVIGFTGMLWLVVLAQTALTKVYVKNDSATEAFARNQLVVVDGSDSMKELFQKGGWIQGELSGKLSDEERQALAKRIFGMEGGMSRMEQTTKDYYVAYGYSQGIPFNKKVNGTRFNMNVAITYDEIENKTVVSLGVPLLNLDF